jgi:hypothetical protein
MRTNLAVVFLFHFCWFGFIDQFRAPKTRNRWPLKFLNGSWKEQDSRYKTKPEITKK